MAVEEPGTPRSLPDMVPDTDSSEDRSGSRAKNAPPGVDEVVSTEPIDDALMVDPQGKVCGYCRKMYETMERIAPNGLGQDSDSDSSEPDSEERLRRYLEEGWAIPWGRTIDDRLRELEPKVQHLQGCVQALRAQLTRQDKEIMALRKELRATKTGPSGSGASGSAASGSGGAAVAHATELIKPPEPRRIPKTAKAGTAEATSYEHGPCYIVRTRRSTKLSYEHGDPTKPTEEV